MIKKKDPIVTGFFDMAEILNSWRVDPNPPKVYIFGKRIHHGLVSAVIGLAGLYKKDPYLVGVGIAGVIDDLPDAQHWLDFESGGDPNSIIDVV